MEILTAVRKYSKQTRFGERLLGLIGSNIQRRYVRIVERILLTIWFSENLSRSQRSVVLTCS